jgi:hypothetical protein
MDDTSADGTLSRLQTSYTTLESSLKRLKISCEQAGIFHAGAFSQSLHLSILEATELVDTIKKADLELLLFHAENEPLRNMEIKVRRWAGILKTKQRVEEYHVQQAKLQTMQRAAEQKTQRLVNEKKCSVQAQIDLVEGVISNTAGTLQHGQVRLAELNREVRQFSTRDVGVATRAAYKACTELDEKRATTQREMEEHKQKIGPVNVEKWEAEKELKLDAAKHTELVKKRNGYDVVSALVLHRLRHI